MLDRLETKEMALSPFKAELHTKQKQSKAKKEIQKKATGWEN